MMFCMFIIFKVIYKIQFRESQKRQGDLIFLTISVLSVNNSHKDSWSIKKSLVFSQNYSVLSEMYCSTFAFMGHLCFIFIYLFAWMVIPES